MLYNPKTTSATPFAANNQAAHRRVRHQIKRGRRTATVRAFTGAKAYLAGIVNTLAEAAEGCGSNVPYVRDAITILQSKDGERLKARVLKDHLSLRAAARQVKPVNVILKTYKMAPGLPLSFLSWLTGRFRRGRRADRSGQAPERPLRSMPRPWPLAASSRAKRTSRHR